MKLPDLRDFDLAGKKVLLRVDFDVPLVRKTEDRRQKTDSRRQKTEDRNEEMVVGDVTRIENALPTIKYLLSVDAKIILLSHLGRPEGKIVSEFSLAPMAEKLQGLLRKSNSKNKIVKIHIKNQKFEGFEINENVVLLENLRFDSREEANDSGFAQKLASLGEFYFRDEVEKTSLPSLQGEDVLPFGKTAYVNDAFAASHREHASIVGLAKILPHAAGLELLWEVKVLSDVLENPRRPVVVILGGTKEDKLEVVPGLLKFADKILIGGKLPSIISNFQFPISNEKVVIGELNEDGKDITLETVEKFGEIIQKAGTVVWAGPMGLYEEDPTSPTASLGAGKWEMGTREIGRAVVNSGAFTIVGGGDTEAALTKFGLVDKIDFISSGGGAMLEFLANGDLPGLKALREG